MKLATFPNATPDGELVVVSSDLKYASSARDICPTLQQALESWDSVAPKLLALSQEIEAGRRADVFDFEAHPVLAPLPRAFQWLDASAFHSHGDLMEQVFNLAPVEGKQDIPLMYQGGSDDLLGANADSVLPTEADGIDFEAELAVIVDRVRMGTAASEALAHVKLLMLANDTSLRNVGMREMKTGFGWVQGKPATAFSCVAVTPDELGSAWSDGRVHLPILVLRNGVQFGRPHAGAMGFGFHQLIAHAARTRNLSAGTIIGSGTVSNADFRTVGSACIAERRAIEIQDSGKPMTPYLAFGERVRIEMFDGVGRSIFGAIDQRVVPLG